MAEGDDDDVSEHESFASASAADLAADLDTAVEVAGVEAEPETGAEASALERLRAALAADGVTLSPAFASHVGGESGVLLRFLRARNLDVAKARKMLADALAWRRETGVDAVLDAPPLASRQDYERAMRIWPSGYHGRDVQGRPVYIERTGDVDLKEALVFGADKFVDLHLRGMEYQARVLLPAASLDAGRLVTQMCNVIDVGGLSLSSINGKVISLLQKVGKIDSDNYPENLGVTLVCNAPWAFTVAWKAVSWVLDEKTRAKFVVLSKDKAKMVAKLEEYLGKHNVPAFLGGTCRCPRGCCSRDPEGNGGFAITLAHEQFYAYCATPLAG